MIEWLEHPDVEVPPRLLDKDQKNPQNLGTKSVVAELHPSVAEEFEEESFLRRLKSRVEFRHQAALALASPSPSTRISCAAVPRSYRREEPHTQRRRQAITSNGTEVPMNLYAGFVKLSDEDADTDDPDKFSGGSLAGWYLICNGRMLLFADKSRFTGWGDDVADYHPQYRRFRGYAYLSGDSPHALEHGQDRRRRGQPHLAVVRNEIVAALREARTVMNRIKPEAPGSAPRSSPMTDQTQGSESDRLVELPKSEKLVVPSGGRAADEEHQADRLRVAVDRFEEVAETLGRRSARRSASERSTITTPGR